MQPIEGKLVAEKVLAECQRDIAELAACGFKLGLAVVLIGDDPASRAKGQHLAVQVFSPRLRSMELSLIL